ncbi:hypothetical protein C2S53_012697 [Perilla frutescens var. hirtella]|uniref:Homing endonuclease LAGLIDADG domain-containing protein n=1 Tax=Perilla frutescens var. hirtella TaxID=608512 RepID=A0AAD4JI35_PERFH|nr:hypothetical protein C2S51_020809 [Perilla frutescens var. frutescens]KAH6833475.1 hypothetical protein C2S53_012697 [Perilla frutescens var. hirtella]
MRRSVAVSAIHLIRGRGFAAPWSHESGNLSRSFSLFSLNCHSDRPFSSKQPRVDSRVRELDDEIYSFNDMVRMRPQPLVVDFTKLADFVKTKHYSVALNLFDEMRLMGALVNDYTMNISINCYFLLKRVDFGFATLGNFFKGSYEPNVIKRLFLDDRLERTRWRPNVMAYNALIEGRVSLSPGKNGISMAESAGNQRHKSSLVGTSETTRPPTYPKSFCEWVAGIIDGDGSIQVSQKGYTSLEITMGLEDLRLLRYVQHMLGGGIKMRAGAKAYRYRLHDHSGMIKLLNCVNGHIRHSARLLQLHRACQLLEIPVILPTPLDARSNWFAGFFDADGTIDIDMKHGLPQLSIRVTNKLLQDVEPYKVVFGGSLYFDSSQNGYYQWSIQSRKDVMLMLDYFKSNTFRSHNSRRFFLIKEYYSLYDLKAFEPDSIHHKVWLAFLDKWNKSMI